MKLKNKYIYAYVLFILPFLFINNVSADYKATVINPSGASCNLYTKGTSTGYCFYSNNNLNSVNSSLIWLDTGDEVTVYTDNTMVKSDNTTLCSDYYVYAGYYSTKKQTTYKGYYCNAYLSSGTLTEELKNEFKNLGFPESYWEKLAILKTAHPTWTFKAINTGLNFSEAVKQENVADRSLIQKSSSNNYAYTAVDSISFDYYNDTFIAYDSTSSSNPWYRANYDTIAYYMDPRNFLNDMYIFQFEGLAYDSNINDETFTKTIAAVFGTDYLSKFTDDFLKAGKESKVSPVYLAALSKQEVGNGISAGTAISGSYNGMYNFYNIGATSDGNPVLNGLAFAAKEDISTLRPWNTEYKAIVGGALWMSDMYISMGQDTSYFKRWNVIYNYLILKGEISNPYKNYQHQYMTNVLAPSSEAVTTYKSYYNSKLLDTNFIFYIPVYNNMPTKTTLPTRGGWPNNYLKSLTINGVDVVDFDGEVENYEYNLDLSIKELTLNANAVSSKAKVEGLGTFKITEDCTKTIKVTAENGDVKTYNIKINLTGTPIEEPLDIATTINNSGIKNNNNYLFGFNINTDIKTIKEKINIANGNAIVTLKNSSNQDKNSGNIATGDKVIVTVGSETKTYEIVLYGDVNGDGKISAVDYVKIKNKIMNTGTLSNSFLEAADVDRNGKVSAVDYVKIKNHIMGTSSVVQ